MTRGFEQEVMLVTDVTTDGRKAMVRDRYGGEHPAIANLRPKGTLPPEPGERWMTQRITGSGLVLTMLMDHPTELTGGGGGYADSLRWAGTWSAITAYEVNHVVQHNGVLYRRLVAGTTAADPVTDTTNWALLVERGLEGPMGPEGPQGVPGAPGEFDIAIQPEPPPAPVDGAFWVDTDAEPYGAPGVWQDFPLTWTCDSGTQPSIGNGIIISRYRRSADSVDLYIYIEKGSTTVVGDTAYQFSGFPLSRFNAIGTVLFSAKGLDPNFVSGIFRSAEGASTFSRVYGLNPAKIGDLNSWSGSSPWWATAEAGAYAVITANYEVLV